MQRRSTAIFHNNGIVPKIIMTVDQLNISYSLSESGLGVCFVTDTLFKFRKHSGVVLYKLPDTEACRMLHIGYKKSRYCNKAISEFINIARDTLKE
jgi:DNA-binding transcriptional LysR family regulator